MPWFRLRSLVAWMCGLAILAFCGHLAVFFGWADTDIPDPPWYEDLAGGLLIGSLLSIGLFLSPWAERRGSRMLAWGVAVTLLPVAGAALILAREGLGDLVRGYSPARFFPAYLAVLAVVTVQLTALVISAIRPVRVRVGEIAR